VGDIYSKKISSQKELNETIDISSYSKGIYFVEAVEVKKVVIE